MKSKINTRQKDPLGTMMLDYLNGQQDVFLTVTSNTLDMWNMTGKTMFRPFGAMNRIEKKALSLCRGKIMDIGAGSGCHSLYLQRKGFHVTALDRSIGCVTVMKKRKVKQVIHDNLFAVQERLYDTLLMLMNGIGIVGSLDGLNLFFQFADTLLTPSGQILLDSTDLAALYDPDILAACPYDYYGQTEFVMTYKDCVSDPFDWLYVDFSTLCRYADFHGFKCEKLLTDKSEKYLARLWRPNYKINRL
jgi:SAM-dependent methyltransferase